MCMPLVISLCKILACEHILFSVVSAIHLAKVGFGDYRFVRPQYAI